MSTPKRSEHIKDARLFRIAVTENLIVIEADLAHLKDCSTCFEQLKRYIHDYVRDQDKQKARLKGGE